MEILKAIEIIEKHNIWRRDNSVPAKTEMANPTELGIAIDEVLSKLNKLLIHGVSNCDLCNGTGYISVDNMVVECHSC